MLRPQLYLYGIGEVSSSWPMQSLETQAVAARTYAFEKVSRLGQHRPGCNCGLYGTTLRELARSSRASPTWSRQRRAS